MLKYKNSKFKKTVKICPFSNDADIIFTISNFTTFSSYFLDYVCNYISSEKR